MAEIPRLADCGPRSNDRFSPKPVIRQARWYKRTIFYKSCVEAYPLMLQIWAVRYFCSAVPSLEIKIALDGGQAPVSRPFDKRLPLEARPAIKAVPEPVP